MENEPKTLQDRFHQIESIVQNGLSEIKCLAISLISSRHPVDEEEEDRLIANLAQRIGHETISSIEDATGIDRYDYITTSGDGYSLSEYYSGPALKSTQRNEIQRTHDLATIILNRRSLETRPERHRS